jgi:hypothetical protein
VAAASTCSTMKSPPRAYLDGPIVAAMKSLPVLSELSVKSFSVLGEPTAVTRGPIEEILPRR